MEYPMDQKFQYQVEANVPPIVSVGNKLALK